VRRVLALPIVALCALAVVACSDDPNSDPPSDPMNAKVELGRPVERGYDRTEWDPAAVEAALALARRTTDTSVGCIDPGPVTFSQVKSSHEVVLLPMPAAVVQCFSNGEDEDLQFSAFDDEEAKDTYIEAKAELICGRALGFGNDTSGGQAGFDGIVYVDAGTVIIEPDSYVVRDLLAQELGATASKMCPEAVGDRPPATDAPNPG
jgi:hypothetical protein